jgi:death-on-curing protein
MNPEPEFLTVEDVLQIHDKQIAAYGGALGIRDQALLESVVGTPEVSFGGAYLHEDLSHMAAAYAFHIAQNQPFLDGNKRTGLVAALVFLDLNNVVVIDPHERLYDALIAVAERRMAKRGWRDCCANSRLRVNEGLTYTRWVLLRGGASGLNHFHQVYRLRQYPHAV